MSSLRRIFVLGRKTLSLRNPYIIFAVLGPFFYAALFQFVFGLWKEKPVVAVYETGEKVIIKELRQVKAVQLVEFSSSEGVRREIEEKKADVGVVFTEDMKSRLVSGERISLPVFVNGESLAKSRVIAFASLVEAMRRVIPESPEILFKQVKLGKERALTLMEMFLPFFVILIIVLGAYMLPASSLVSEKEKKTLTAVLVTPVSLAEVMIAYSVSGILISLVMGTIILALTVGLLQPLLLLVIFMLGSIMAAEWGIILGLVSRDQASLVANMKALNIFLLAPALFVIFPSWPQWIAKIFPTYYIVNPVFRISIYGESWGDLGWQVLVLGVFAIIFVFPVILLARRMEGKVF